MRNWLLPDGSRRGSRFSKNVLGSEEELGADRFRAPPLGECPRGRSARTSQGKPASHPPDRRALYEGVVGSSPLSAVVRQWKRIASMRSTKTATIVVIAAFSGVFQFQCSWVMKIPQPAIATSA